VVMDENPLHHSNREWEGGATSVVSK